MIYSKLTSY